MRIVVTLTFIALLAGCANPYAQFYTDQTDGEDLAASDRVILSNAPPKVYAGSEPEADSQTMMQNGYVMVGYSHFNAASAEEPQLLAQAKKVHAEIVLTYAEYTNTVSGAVPLTLPNTQTSNTTMTGTAYGSGGFTTMSGTATTTTTGTKTTYIPYNTNRYDFGASYWVKLKPLSLGVYYDDLTPETRRAIGSNKGVYVVTVVNDSPAFMADIFPGDIIKRINGAEVINSEDCSSRIRALAGTTVDLAILRDGEEVTKTVELRP